MGFIAYDLGTGGVKASLYNSAMQTLGKSFVEYDTTYPRKGYMEQRPQDWWNKVVESTRILLGKTGIRPEEIECVALSGASCVGVPLDSKGNTLLESVPIWSDTRASEETREFFTKTDESEWYMRTGCGFPSECYLIFKLIWLKKHQPDIFSKIYKVLGSKDYINYRLTGNYASDYSYAASFGIFDIHDYVILEDYLDAAGISRDIFPDIVSSHTIIGEITREAAEEIGLREGTRVACGAVDNACMAMGAVGAQENKVYVSLGSSSWIPINSSKPILNAKTKPYVFPHIQEGMYTSAYSIFAGGSSFKWIKNTLCKDFCSEDDAYDRMTQLSQESPVGANGIFFNPSLAGGTSQDKSVNIRGAFIGLHLGTTREDLIRAGMEGICMNLKMSLDLLEKEVPVDPVILFCGGGSKSAVWMQMFADVFDKKILKTNIDQDAASLGAAAICAVASGLWKDYSGIPDLHKTERLNIPDKDRHLLYSRLQTKFEHIADVCADLGDVLLR